MSHLESIQQHLAPELARMNEIIHTVLYTPNQMMNQIVEGYLQRKGKQIRPILVILSAKMLGEVNEDVFHAGSALEMLHNASLIHDDIIDETMLRRGVATVNATWGNHIAVLVGDFFVSNALYAGIRTGHLSIISALSALGKELSLGEIDQICNARSHSFDEESYISMIRKKTASLFMNCVRMGAEASGAPEELIEPMVRYAELLGLCFQIKDDIFDYFPNEALGKPTGNDLREGKVTMPLLYALSAASDSESSAMKELLMKDVLSTEDINMLINFAIDHGGIDYAYRYMHKMQEEADKIILQYPETEWRECFRDIFDFIISRNH